MTKKVSKKNLLCLFPPKSGNGKRQAELMKLQQQLSELGELNGHIRPNSTFDWQAHYDYLEASSLGATFGSDQMIEELALRAVQIAHELGDRDKIAKSYSLLFRHYSETNHPDALSTGNKSVEAAISAYGESAVEVADELSLLAVNYEFTKYFDKAIELLDASIKIYQSVGTTEQLIDALEIAIWNAGDCGRGDKVEEYAQLGLQIVAERCKDGVGEFAETVEYFEQMIEAAHEPPVIEEQRSKLLEVFPGLAKLFPTAGSVLS